VRHAQILARPRQRARKRLQPAAWRECTAGSSADAHQADRAATEEQQLGERDAAWSRRSPRPSIRVQRQHGPRLVATKTRSQLNKMAGQNPPRSHPPCVMLPKSARLSNTRVNGCRCLSAWRQGGRPPGGCLLPCRPAQRYDVLPCTAVRGQGVVSRARNTSGHRQASMKLSWCQHARAKNRRPDPTGHITRMRVGAPQITVVRLHELHSRRSSRASKSPQCISLTPIPWPRKIVSNTRTFLYHVASHPSPHYSFPGESYLHR